MVFGQVDDFCSRCEHRLPQIGDEQVEASPEYHDHFDQDVRLGVLLGPRFDRLDDIFEDEVGHELEGEVVEAMAQMGAIYDKGLFEDVFDLWVDLLPLLSEVDFDQDHSLLDFCYLVDQVLLEDEEPTLLK